MIVGFDNYKSKYNFNVSGVIHVGAHIGQEYNSYTETFGNINTHWFEPLEDVFDNLRINLFHKSKVKLYNFGLGEKVEEVEMFVDSGNDGQSSSILKPKKHTEQFPHIKFENSNKRKIKVDRLDNFDISDSNMLVLDTQGFELNVLKGSTRTLEKIDYIFTEFNTIEMYESCPTLHDIDSFLENFGFERVETWYTDSNWGDAFYLKRNNETKSIVIIDCFVANQLIELKLIDQIEKLKKNNFDILLISNTKVCDRVLEKVDYYIYDKRNQLFESTYTNVMDIDFIDYIYIGDEYQFTLHKVSPGLQRHGLSVLVNLYNSVSFVKSLGYTHFWRVEVDDLFGSDSLMFIKSSENILKEHNKKAVLYYNESLDPMYPNNISFHFMYWNIDYFLEKIPQIKNEKDYKNIILKNFNSLDFVIAEEFIYRFIKMNGDADVLVKDGSKMDIDLKDTVWNTNASLSNLSPKFENCWTSLFNMRDREGLFLFTKNLSNSEKVRKIVIYYHNKTEEVNQILTEFNSWCWNIIDKNPYKFEIYENNRLLYTEQCDEIKNYVEFP